MLDDDFRKINSFIATSPEVFDSLKIYQNMLLKWQKKVNLISNNTVDDCWNRHFIDSAQLVNHISPDDKILDVGSGAGFPGMVIAIYGFRNIELVESDSKKCIFLSEVSRGTKSTVIIHNDRVENLNKIQFDVITSRACASVSQLFSWTENLVSHGTKCLFPKGKNYSIEIEEANNAWEFNCKVHPSVIEKDSVILEFSDLRRRQK